MSVCVQCRKPLPNGQQICAPCYGDLGTANGICHGPMIETPDPNSKEEDHGGVSDRMQRVGVAPGG